MTRVLPVIAVGLLSAPIEAQSQDSSWRPSPRLFHKTALGERHVTGFGIERGFPSQNIEAVAYDASGRLWIGSLGGLFTFDGAQIAQLPHRNASDTSPSGQTGADVLRVASLLRDRAGCMWVGTYSGGLRCYSSDVFTEIDTKGMAGCFDLVYESKDGAIWAGGTGLLRIENGRSIVIIEDGSEQSRSTITSVAESDDPENDDPENDDPENDDPDNDAIWISTLGGLARWDPQHGLEWIDDVPTLGTFFDAAGRQWRVTSDGFSVDGIFEEIQPPLRSSKLRSVVPITDQQLLLVMDPESLIVTLGKSSITTSPFRPGKRTNQAIAGPGGSLWVATDRDGLQLWEPMSFVSLEMPESAPSPLVCRPIQSGGVIFGDWGDDRVWQYQPDGSSSGSRLGGVIVELDYPQPEGADETAAGVFDLIAETPSRFVLNGGRGVLEIDGDQCRVLKEFVGLSQPTAPMARTNSGALWARSVDSWVEFSDGQQTGRSLKVSATFITGLQAVGEMLYVAHEGGIEAIDTIDLSRSVALALPANAYGGLYVEDGGDIWVGTDGYGLYRKRSTGEIDHWTEEDGLPTAFMGWVGLVPGLTEDTHLWINSNVGVLAVTRESLDATVAKTLDKLEFTLFMSGESLGPGGAALDSGILVLPTVGGPIAVDTAAPLMAPSAPVLSINAVRSSGKLVSAGTELLGDTDLEFEYEAAEFPHKLTSRVEYRLEGHDSEWQLGGPDGRARYTSLGPGRYQLQLRSRAAGAPYRPTLKGEWLEILPRWYQRPSAWFAMAAALMGLGFCVVRLRTMKLVKYGMRLEGEIALRNVAEAELLISRERYLRLFRTTPTPLAAWSRDGDLIEYNEAAAKLFGAATLTQTPVTDLVVGQKSRDLLASNVAIVRDGQSPAPMTAETYVQNGETRSCTWHLACLGPRERPEGRFVAVVSDKSQEVQAASDLRRLRQQLVHAEEQERSRMARELHDDFSQRLAAVSLNLQMTADSAGDALEARDQARLLESQVGIDALATDIHNLSRQLHPAVLDDLGLSAALRSECTRRASLTGRSICFEIRGEGHDPGQEICLALFRVAQEALHNATRHGKAEDIAVLLKRSSSRVQLIVMDDGEGFDKSQTSGPGLGLSSMRERMELIGGELTIVTKPGHGTKILATIEFASDTDKDVPAVSTKLEERPASNSISRSVP